MDRLEKPLLGAAAVALILLAGCNDPYADIDRRKTIVTGVYGMIRTYDDAGMLSGSPGGLVFRGETAFDVTSVTSEPDGFFEVELAPGDYEVCVSTFICDYALTIVEGHAVRCIYDELPSGETFGCDPMP